MQSVYTDAPRSVATASDRPVGYLGASVPTNLREAVRKRAEADDCSMSRVVRQAVRQYLSDEGNGARS